jgi:hypothetical protein
MLGFHLCIRLELKFKTDLNSKLNGQEIRKKGGDSTWAVSA